MALELTDSLKREKRPFVPIEPGRVRMYVCGVTVYDDSHLGHARSGVAFDILARWLRESGYQLTFVKNFTDIDDKIIHRANERGVEWHHITEQYIESYHRDMGQLGLLPPTHEPKATDHIPHMIRVIEALQKNGLAYAAEGNVYFDVLKYPPYLKLSRRRLEESNPEDDQEEPNPSKRHPADFTLWKAQKPGEPAWDSPWGKGRPGWHIECSAMAREHLGQPFDIHGGGLDLIFPHHENEIAQSEGAYGTEFARYWLHNGFLMVDGKKMSKSLGNFLTIREVLARLPAEAIRMFFLSARYREPLDFSWSLANEGLKRLGGLYAAVAAADEKTKTHQDSTIELGNASDDGARRLAEEISARFAKAMDDDLNTSVALSVLDEMATAMNRLTAKPRINQGEHDLLVKMRHELLRHARMLGLMNEEAVRWIARYRTAGAQLDSTEIEAKIAERAAAKAAKNYKQADAIRDWLLERGIVLEDKSGATIWRVRN